MTCVSGNIEARAGRDQHAGGAGARRPNRRRGRDRARARRSSGRSRRPPRRTDRAASAMRSCPPPSRAAERPPWGRPDRRGGPTRPGEITLVTLGPLTNLALALAARARAYRGCSAATRSWAARSARPATRPRRPSGTSTATRTRRRSSSARGRRRWPPTDRSRGRWRWAWTSPSWRGSQPDARRPSRPARRQHPGRFDRPRARRRPDARRQRSVASQSDRPLHRRRAALLLRVPPALRRLLRRVHPRSAGGRGGPGPRAGRDRAALRRRRDARGADDGDDRRGPSAAHRQAGRTSTWPSRRTSRRSCERLIERVGGLAADRSAVGR